MAKLSKEIIEVFVMHPDWHIMEEYIEGHFDNSIDIHAVDVSRPASTVVGEVIASQKIAQDVKSLKDSFGTMRQQYGKVKTSYE